MASRRSCLALASLHRVMRWGSSRVHRMACCCQRRGPDRRLALMNRISRMSYLLLMAAWLTLAPQFTAAADTALLSGSYQIVRSSNAGPQTRVRLLLHLTNRGQHDLNIRRLTLRDFSHAERGGIQNCSLSVPAGASSDTTQEFTISRADYELWRRGTRPRLILEVLAPSGRGTTEVVRLGAVKSDRASSGKAN